LKAHLIRTKQRALLAKSDSNHWLVLDAGEKAGGHDAASSPSETLLMAAGGCTAMDQLYIIEKSRKQLTRYELHLNGTRAETHPKIFRRIHFHAIAEGDCSPEQFKRAMDMSLSKYCSVSHSLDRSIRFFASFELNGVEEGTWEIPRNVEYYEDGNEQD
jgi:putative redox protein